MEEYEKHLPRELESVKIFPSEANMALLESVSFTHTQNLFNTFLRVDKGERLI